MSLTPQMRKAAQVWINTRNPKKAGLDAGLPQKSAKNVVEGWLKLPEVVQYINEEIDKSAIKTKVTRDWIMDEAVKVLRGTTRDDIKLQALSLLDKLQTKIETEGDEANRPTIQIISDGDLTIL